MEKILNIAYTKYQMIHKEKEITGLVEFIKEKGCKNFLEIGTQKGGTFYTIIHFLKPDSVCISVDNTNHPEKLKVQQEVYENNPTINLICGDSHRTPTFNEVKRLLNGNKVDVLMIDGDHSYKGVKQDYYDYKQFVTEQGMIVFHDILDTKFHSLNGCNVAQLWKELKGEKHEIVDLEDTKQPITKQEIGQWGGIGVLINETVQYELTQIYYPQVLHQYMKIRQAKQYENKKLTPYYENEVIKEVCTVQRAACSEKSFTNANDGHSLQTSASEEVGHSLQTSASNIDKCFPLEKGETLEKMYGCISWKFIAKTKFTSETLDKAIQGTNNQYSVIFMPPFYNRMSNWTQRNKEKFTELYQISEMIDKTGLLPFSLTSGKWTCSYSNFWLAKRETYLYYCDTTLKTIYEIFEMPEIRDFAIKHTIVHGGKNVALFPFVMEVLMGFHVNYYKIPHTTICEEGTQGNPTLALS